MTAGEREGEKRQAGIGEDAAGRTGKGSNWGRLEQLSGHPRWPQGSAEPLPTTPLFDSAPGSPTSPECQPSQSLSKQSYQARLPLLLSLSQFEKPGPLSRSQQPPGHVNCNSPSSFDPSASTQHPCLRSLLIPQVFSPSTSTPYSSPPPPTRDTASQVIPLTSLRSSSSLPSNRRCGLSILCLRFPIPTLSSFGSAQQDGSSCRSTFADTSLPLSALSLSPQGWLGNDPGWLQHSRCQPSSRVLPAFGNASAI